MWELHNDKNETVVLVIQNEDNTVTAWFGVESIINDMEFFTSMGHEIMYDIIQIMLKIAQNVLIDDEL